MSQVSAGRCGLQGRAADGVAANGPPIHCFLSQGALPLQDGSSPPTHPNLSKSSLWGQLAQPWAPLLARSCPPAPGAQAVPQLHSSRDSCTRHSDSACRNPNPPPAGQGGRGNAGAPGEGGKEMGICGAQAGQLPNALRAQGPLWAEVILL